MQRINGSLLPGLDTGQSILNVLNLPKLTTVLQKISLRILLQSTLVTHHRQTGLISR